MKSKIDKILRKCIKVCNCDARDLWHIHEKDYGWATREIMELIEAERMNGMGGTESGVLKCDEVMVAILQKYLKMPNATFEQLCQKCDELVKKDSKELKVSYDEWRKSIDRIRELKSIIKQARANCFSNKPHKTIMGILDKGLKEPL